LDHVVTPPGLLGRNRAFDDFTAKRGESIDVQCHEQARLVSSRGILAKDDLASHAMDLADPARAVALMPTLLEAELVDVEAKRTVHVSNEEQTVAFAMICNEMYDAGRRGHRSERLVAHWRQAGNYPIGRLGIPLDYYVRCAQAMHDARAKKSVEGFLVEVATYVHRAAEVLRSASHDRFHWLRLESTVLPAEPEAVAMTTAMSTISRAIFGVPISEMPNLDSHGRLLVEIGDQMWQAGQRDDQRRG